MAFFAKKNPPDAPPPSGRGMTSIHLFLFAFAKPFYQSHAPEQYLKKKNIPLDQLERYSALGRSPSAVARSARAAMRTFFCSLSVAQASPAMGIKKLSLTKL